MPTLIILKINNEDFEQNSKKFPLSPNVKRKHLIIVNSTTEILNKRHFNVNKKYRESGNVEN